MNYDRRDRHGQATSQVDCPSGCRRPGVPFVIWVTVAVAATIVSGIPPCSGMPSLVAERRLALTPRSDPPASRDRRTDSTDGADGGGGGHGGAATSFFGMEASNGFDLSSETIEICTSTARCGTFGRATPGWRPGDRVPNDELASGPRRYWWGHDGNSTLNLITHGADDRVFGSMVDGDSGLIYNFGYDADGAPLVRATPTSEFSEGHLDDCLTNHHESEHEEELPDDTGRTADGPAAPQERVLNGDDGSELDVMVVWTDFAECSQSGLGAGCTLSTTTYDNMVALIELAVVETNTAFTASGVTTELKLVHYYRESTYVESSFTDTAAFDDALNAIRTDGDGNMDNVHTLRTTHAADIVAMIIGTSGSCGLAPIGPAPDKMFSVSRYSCATGYFSFGHEIGHNLGLNHDRGTEDTCSHPALVYQYGYRDPAANFRSILGYNCVAGQCDNNTGGGCTRVQMFSQPNYLWNGAAIGTATEDNARKIKDGSATVAAYYESSTRSTANPTAAPTPSPTGCVDTFVPPPSPPEEACATTSMARFSKQCERRPAFVSSYMDKVDDLTATACADLCLSRFSCRSFTHLESNGRCQLYAKPYSGVIYHRHHASKTMYRLIPCIPECPTSGDIMDRYTRAADFRTVTEDCVDDGNGGETCTTNFAHPAVDPTSGVYEGGYRPRFASDFTFHCTTEACQTVAGCAQACFDSGTTGSGACKSFNFKSDGTQCKFYRKAYVPEYLVKHGSKQYYHLTVGSNCISS